MCSTSRKCSAIVRPDRATRIRTPGDSFIWPKTRAVLSRDAALPHLFPEVVALAATFADTGEDRVAAVLHRDVVDQLLDQDRLADAGAAEQADLAALGIGFQQVDDLDAGLEDLDGRALVLKGRGLAVDAGAGGPLRGPALPPSIGSPRTLNIRPRVISARPGTVMVLPGAATSIPR